MMQRRGFLKGVFGGVAAAGIIVAAKPEDIAAWTSPLARDTPVVLDASPVAVELTVGESLYNSRGELVAIVQSLECRTQPIEVSMFGDTHRGFIPGRQEVEIRAAFIGHLERDGSHRMPRLRGLRPRA